MEQANVGQRRHPTCQGDGIMKKHLHGHPSSKDGAISPKNTPNTPLKESEAAKTARRESVSKITDRVLKEHRAALDWLAGK